MKKLISLILVLVLCTGLAGCMDKDELAQLQLQSDLYLKYAGVIDALENKEYNHAIHQIGGMIIEEQKLSEEPHPPVADTLCANAWYPRVTEDSNPPMEMRFSNDGTCTIGGQAMTWLEIGSDDTSLSAVILDNGAHKYIVSINAETISQPRVSLYTSGMNEYGYYSDGHIANYYTHPMISTAMVSWWQAGRTDELPARLHLYEYSCSIHDLSYAWEVAESTDDSLLTLRAFNQDGKSGKEYTIRLQDRDGIYVLMVTENGTDIEATYYNENYGKDDTWTEVIYAQARTYLERYLSNNNTIYVNDVTLTPNQSRAYLYELFSQTAGYRDSADYLARFSTIPSQLVKYTETNIDQLDKSHINTESEYYYNPDGTLDKARGMDIIETYGIYNTDYQHFTYDTTGKISKIVAGYNPENPSAIGTPEYDESGKLVSMAVQTSSGTYTSTFTYDDQGRIATTDINHYDSYYRRQITYTYGEDGKLVQKVTARQNGYYTYTEDYTYTDDALTKIVETYSYRYGKGYTTDYVITNDDHGRPLSVVITTTNSSYTYKSTTLNYYYEDLYFMDVTGLLEQNN